MLPPPPNDDLIVEYLDQLSRERPESTIRTYRTPLRKADRELPGGLFSSEPEIEDWLRRYGRATRSVYRAALVGWYAHAIELGWIDYNPASGLASVRVPKRLPRPCTDEDVETILTRADQPIRRWSTIMAYAGLRCVEVARLNLPDDITEEVVYVLGKGGIPGVVPTHPLIWRAVQGLPPGPLAGGRSRLRVSDLCNEEYRRLGLSCTAHQLRHWYGTRTQQATGDVRVTQELMRHKSVLQTQGYTLVAGGRMRQAILGLPMLTAEAAAAGPAS